MRITGRGTAICLGVFLAAGSTALYGQIAPGTVPGTVRGSEYGTRPGTIELPAGIGFKVRLDHKITLAEATSGDSWTGTLADNLVLASGMVLARAGALVKGSVHLVPNSAALGDSPRAMLKVVQVSGYGVETSGRTIIVSQNGRAKPTPAGSTVPDKTTGGSAADPAATANTTPATENPAAPRLPSSQVLSFTTE
jgi:hypothetical protein